MGPHKTFLNGAVIVVAAFSIGVFVYRFGPTLSAQTVSSIKPFTGTYSVVDYAGDGLAVPLSSELRGFALRGDGANVVSLYRQNPAGGTGFVSIDIVTDPTARKATRLVPFLAYKTTYRLTDDEANQERSHLTGNCSGETAPAILNYQVVKSREIVSSSATTNLGPAYDKIITDRWRAPALNCQPLRSETTMLKENKVVQRRIEAYLSIKEGEPDGKVFVIPANYVEHKPSEAIIEASRRFPNDPRFSPLGDCNVTALDDVYLRSLK